MNLQIEIYEISENFQKKTREYYVAFWLHYLFIVISYCGKYIGYIYIAEVSDIVKIEDSAFDKSTEISPQIAKKIVRVICNICILIHKIFR